jgi:hypothetical protein
MTTGFPNPAAAPSVPATHAANKHTRMPQRGQCTQRATWRVLWGGEAPKGPLLLDDGGHVEVDARFPNRRQARPLSTRAVVGSRRRNYVEVQLGGPRTLHVYVGPWAPGRLLLQAPCGGGGDPPNRHQQGLGNGAALRPGRIARRVGYPRAQRRRLHSRHRKDTQSYHNTRFWRTQLLKTSSATGATAQGRRCSLGEARAAAPVAANLQPPIR